MKTVSAGVHQLQIQRFVNVYFIDAGEPGQWVLLDAGLPGAAPAIRAAAEKRYGPGTRPEAILLTHGHFDHVGAALELAQGWGVPVVAHPLEVPFLTRWAFYPPADPTVGGSLGFASRFFPPDVPDLSAVLEPLPLDSDAVPYLLGWRWLHVPGHAPGQIALWREADRTLLAADAFATTRHSSVADVLLNVPKISVAGEPFNYDWAQCQASVQRLAALEPHHIGCGHGPVQHGPRALAALQKLAAHYPVPTHGRYHQHPAVIDDSGVEYLPPPAPDALPQQAVFVGVGLAVAGLTWALLRGWHQRPQASARPRPATFQARGLRGPRAAC